jgi:hypothetical protein
MPSTSVTSCAASTSGIARQILRVSASICISFGAVAAPPAPPLDFKELALGAPITAAQVEARLNSPCVSAANRACDALELVIHERQKVSCGQGSQGMTVCNGATTVAGFSSEINVVIGANGLLRRVMLSGLDPDNFDAIRAELQGKFGPPKSQQKSGVQNAYGAQFQQIESVWTDSNGGRIEFSKYAGSIERSRLYFSTAEDRERVKATQRGTKGDL